MLYYHRWYNKYKISKIYIRMQINSPLGLVHQTFVRHLFGVRQKNLLGVEPLVRIAHTR